jgi:hypothetical protein
MDIDFAAVLPALLPAFKWVSWAVLRRAQLRAVDALADVEADLTYDQERRQMLLELRERLDLLVAAASKAVDEQIKDTTELFATLGRLSSRCEDVDEPAEAPET